MVDRTGHLTAESNVDLRIAHLNMIQGVISRLSGFSASAKNFCITLSAAIIAVAFEKGAPLLIWAVGAVIVIFFLMDSYYLSLERRYRALHEDVAARPLDVATDVSLKTTAPTWRCFAEAMVSVSVIPFYVLLVASLAGLLYVADYGLHYSPETAVVSASGAAGAAEEDRRQSLRQTDTNTVSPR